MIRVVLNRVLPFILGGLVGVAAFYAFYLVMPIDGPGPFDVSSAGSGSGSARCTAKGTGMGGSSAGSFEPEGGISSAFRITSKPRATYTDAARENNVEGSVLLKVTLLASGEIGGVSVVRGLPDGLTEQAVKAAKQIEFEPKKVNGVPVSVTQTFEYTFDIY